MILVSVFSEDNVISDKIKNAIKKIIFEYQSNENRAFRFFFLGTPGISIIILLDDNNEHNALPLYYIL